MKPYNKFVTICFGWMGLHRFMAGQILSGIIYFCTCGVCGIGWIIDIIKCFSKKNNYDNSLPKQNFYVPIKKLPVVYTNDLFLQPGEICHYQGQAYVEKISERVAGYTSEYGGGSVRIAKGLSVHSGGGNKRTVRETVSRRDYGKLFVTNKRIVFLSKENPIDKTFDKITSFSPLSNSIIFQFGNSSFEFFNSDVKHINDVINGIRTGMEVM